MHLNFMETLETQLEAETEDPVLPGLTEAVTKSSQGPINDRSPSEKAVCLVAEELKEATDFIDRRAREFASFIIPGFIEGHFTLDSEEPNPVHERIHKILNKLNQQRKLPEEIAVKLFGPASEA